MYVLYVTQEVIHLRRNNCPGDVGDDLRYLGDLVPSSGSNNDCNVGVVGAESSQFSIEYEEWLKCNRLEVLEKP